MKREPRGKFDPAKMVSGGSVELPVEQHQEAVRQIAIADEECRVNFRWGSAQLDIVKQVAEKMGVSYQQYIKQVLYRQAHADLQRFNCVPGDNELLLAKRTDPSCLSVSVQWEKYINAGMMACKQGLYSEAEKAFFAALTEAEKFGPQSTRLLESLRNLAKVYNVQEKYAEAESLYKRALAIDGKVLSADNHELAPELGESLSGGSPELSV